MSTRISTRTAYGDRSLAELAAQERDDLLGLFLKHVDTHIFIKDAGGHYLYASPNTCEALQRPLEEILGHTDADILKPEVAADFMKFDQQVFASSQPLCREETITYADGTARTFLSEKVSVRQDDGTVMLVGFATETTGLRKQEEALRISEERHRFLAENARDVIWTTEPDGRISYVSPSVEAVRGFTPQEAMAQQPEQIHPPESLALTKQWWERLQADMAAGRQPSPFRGELAYYRRDGSICWSEVMAYPLMRPDGSLAQVIGVTRDMSERKRSELALQQSERKFRTLFEAGRSALFLMDHEGRFLEANPAAWRLFRCPTSSGLVGTTWIDWSPPVQPCGTASSTAACAYLRRASNGEDLDFEWTLRRRADESEFPGEVTITRIQVDGQSVLLASVEDLTEIKQSAAALARSEEHYRLLSANMYGTVLLVDRDSVVTWVSPSLTKTLGYEPQEWIGRRSIDFLVPEDAPRALANIERATSKAESVVARYSVHDRAGHLHTAETYATPFFKTDGTLDGLQVSFHLIDAQVAAEQELEHRARTDELTSLLNRREIFDRIREITGEVNRSGLQLAVLFCDLDEFKCVNDTHGHSIGDEVLSLVAERLRASLRNADDLAARMGGDELMVILRGVRDLNDALDIAEKLRMSVTEPLPTSAGPLRVTMSIGVALARPDESAEQIISRADAAMYQSKRTRRNQVVPVT